MTRTIAHSLALFSFFVQPFLASDVRTRAGQDPARGQTVRRQSETPAGSALDYDESHALIIGISQYTHGWRDLPGVRKDVEEVRGALQNQGFQVTVKLDLTQAELDRALRDFVGAHGQQPKNRLVIYFAGHGHSLTTKDGRSLGYIVPADAPVPDEKNPGPFKSFAISMSDIEKFAREIESKHALFVFDSCFSGSLFSVRSDSVPDSISDLTDQQVRQFITAGTEKQAVPDVSVFRAQFVKALAGEADRDRDGYVTGTELGYFLRTTVTDYTRKKQTPEFGKIRDAELDKGDIVFVTPGGAITRRPPPPRREEAAPAAADNPTPGAGGRWVVVADKRIEVAVNEAATDTGIQVRQGQYLTLRATGQRINLGNYGYAGPGGVSRADARKPLGDCPTGALFARLGQEMICIETEKSFTAQAAGKLQLGLNESNLSDNQGALVVKVTVQEFRP